MVILSVNNCGVVQRYNGNDLKFNLREPTTIDFRCNRYITSFCGNHANLINMEVLLFHTVEPNLRLQFSDDIPFPLTLGKPETQTFGGSVI